MIGQKSVRTDEQGGTHTEEEVYNDMGDIIKIVDIMDHYLWLGTYNWTYSDIMEYSYTYYPSGNKSYCKTKTYWNDKLTGEGETYYNDDAENSVSDSNWVDYD